MKPEPNTLFHDRYLLQQKLGVGGFSEVWKATDNKAGDMEVAIKIFAPGSGLDTKGLEVFSKEYSLVFNLNHLNLLKPSHFDDWNGQPYLVMPFMKNGSCADRVGEFTENDAALFLKNIGGALKYLHNLDPPIIHQDIKPDNIMLDDNNNFLLSDFGISSKLRRTLTKSLGEKAGSSGTTAFMPPERFSQKMENRIPVKANDVFSLGATLFELLTGELPFGNLGGIALNSGVKVPLLPEFFSPNLNNILGSCLCEEPWKRPTADELVTAAEEFQKTGAWPEIKKENLKEKETELTTQIISKETKELDREIIPPVLNQEIKQEINDKTSDEKPPVIILRETREFKQEKNPLATSTKNIAENTNKPKNKKHFILIGCSILFVIIGFFIFRFYYNKEEKSDDIAILVDSIKNDTTVTNENILDSVKNEMEIQTKHLQDSIKAKDPSLNVKYIMDSISKANSIKLQKIKDSLAKKDKQNSTTLQKTYENTDDQEIVVEETENTVVEQQAPVLTIVETMPVYIGGETAMYEFLGNNIIYPQAAKEASITGTVIVTFVVEKDGGITSVTVLRDIGGGCGEEAVRVVKSMPKWKPGKQSGNAVRVQFNLPIRFSLN